MITDKNIEQVEKFIGAKIMKYQTFNINNTYYSYRIINITNKNKYLKTFKLLNPNGYDYNYREMKQELYDNKKIINDTNINELIFNKVTNIVTSIGLVIDIEAILKQIKILKLKSILNEF